MSYVGENPSCEEARLCPLFSLTDLFAEGGCGRPITRARAEALLQAIPPYLSEAVVTRDPETGEVGDAANIPFGIRIGPLDEQQELIDEHPLRDRRRRAARPRGRPSSSPGCR